MGRELAKESKRESKGWGKGEEFLGLIDEGGRVKEFVGSELSGGSGEEKKLGSLGEKK